MPGVNVGPRRGLDDRELHFRCKVLTPRLARCARAHERVGAGKVEALADTAECDTERRMLDLTFLLSTRHVDLRVLNLILG